MGRVKREFTLYAHRAFTGMAYSSAVLQVMLKALFTPVG
jgi:hypothetical protein